MKVQPVKTSGEWRSHMAAIGKIIARWQEGEISTAAKRDAIAAENLFYHQRPTHSRATGELLTLAVGEVQPAPQASAPEPPPSWWDDEDDERTEWWKR